MKFNLKPYLSSTKYASDLGNASKYHYWVFSYNLKKALPRALVAKWFNNLYPEVEILDLKIIKTYKITKFVFKCNIKPPWTKV